MKTEKELNPEVLEEISGGYIHYNEDAPAEKQWEVVDKQGNVVFALSNRPGAEAAGRNLGWTGIVLTDEQLRLIQGHRKQQ